ncbi:hypothetical protein SUGI_0566840 [Cryptomeria japonica]|nr:hypothetical protein SUGI_0566840 [Cryptomeria japonica]
MILRWPLALWNFAQQIKLIVILIVRNQTGDKFSPDYLNQSMFYNGMVLDIIGSMEFLNASFGEGYNVEVGQLYVFEQEKIFSIQVVDSDKMIPTMVKFKFVVSTKQLGFPFITCWALQCDMIVV